MPKYDKADIERRMHGAVESLKGDLAGLRTGRANVHLLDPVVVEVYGSMMPLSQVATVSAPDRIASSRRIRACCSPTATRPAPYAVGSR